MANFLARALRYLGSAYDIRGSEVSTNEIDLSSVQLVHDVQPMLASGRAIGFQDGYTVARIGFEVDDEAAPATPTSILHMNPYTQGGGIQAAGFGDEIPLSHDLWLYGIGASSLVFISGSSVTSIAPFLRLSTSMIGIREQTGSATATGIWFSLGRFTQGNLGTGVSNTQMRLLGSTSTTTGRSTLGFPFRIPREDTSVTLGAVVDWDLPGTDDGSKAMEAWVDFLVRAVPRGLYPGP